MTIYNRHCERSEAIQQASSPDWMAASASPPRHDAAWIPWTIIAFFASFMALLAGFAWIAFHTYTGEVTDNAYKKGLAYNADIAHAHSQAELGWRSHLDIAPEGHYIVIAFALRDASGHAIDDAQIMARAARQTQAGHDRQVMLRREGEGLYRGRMQLDWPGAWDIRISATQRSNNYQQSKTIVIP